VRQLRAGVCRSRGDSALGSQTFVDVHPVATVYIRLGDTARALENLEQPYADGSGFLVALTEEREWATRHLAEPVGPG